MGCDPVYEGNHSFTRAELDEIFTHATGKTLGEVDSAHVFSKTLTNPKITGIAGDVVEQSLLRYPPDSKQAPDLNVDGTPTELKVTGLKRTKKKGDTFHAKEPMSITAVQPDKISSQTFETSPFWHKVSQMLIVYYLYDSATTVQAADYADFVILGYQFHRFDEDELRDLRKDWQLVHDFLTDINENSENPEAEYPRLSSELRSKLNMIDTAPKYPHPPRFRLKRSVVDTMYQKYLGTEFTILPNDVNDLESLDKLCDHLTARYSGKTTLELMEEFGIPLNSTGKLPKNVHEQITTAMLGSPKSKLNSLELFARTGLIAKTIPLLANGLPKEDTKFYHIDFSDFTQESIDDTDTDETIISRAYTFSDSELYAYLHEQSFFFTLFQFTDPKQRKEDGTSVFRGFRRITIPDEDIEKYGEKLWNHTRTLIMTDSLEDVPTGTRKKTSGDSTAPNFMKSSQNPLFIRGSAANSDDSAKTEEVNGIRMIPQYFWMKKQYIQQLISSSSPR
ncbi:MutH/Sau3AI family endonuclease [Alloscardovia macacae]|uniref:DNA mismatch repair enzyme MutH n=1 Tax=Alloscardovia macacae TaxID=1160091 RepID=A0A261F442_9BIFI|nr:MutH/Sau3AI family endonuclease [Alloscardovia macacae]OZG53890.1 DNA mismatch repair enzyme MutH [Alloscardovia macacae]